ncbi:MAG TPA: hypothetical protein VHW23_10550 [Kofleriaceae bacterium]|nr:hypothetical protein [Kofleriaceae bacterium]
MLAGALELVEQRPGAGRDDLDAGTKQGHGDGLGHGGGASGGGGKALLMDAMKRADVACCLGNDLDEAERTAYEDLAIGEIGHQRAQILRVKPATLDVVVSPGMDPQPVEPRRQARELGAEDRITGVAGSVDHDDATAVASVAGLALAPIGEIADHRHDRRDPAAAADQEKLRRSWRVEHEPTGGCAEPDDGASAQLMKRSRHTATRYATHRDLDPTSARCRAARRDRVAPAHAGTIDFDLDRDVLAGAMPRPAPSRGEHECPRVSGLVDHVDDARAWRPERPGRSELAEPELRVTVEKPAAPRGDGDSRDGFAKLLVEARSASGRPGLGEHSIAYISA